MAIPQMPFGALTPLFMKMYPFSPHEEPQLFLTIQYSGVYPTTTTAWSSWVPHGPSYTPPLYMRKDEELASMAAATGRWNTAASSSV